jgi:hypothetical protein
MKRTQIQLSEEAYRTLRRKAFERGISLSALIRELLDEALGKTTRGQSAKIKRYSFVGAGCSVQDDLAPVSERHDEALARGAGKGKEQ